MSRRHAAERAYDFSTGPVVQRYEALYQLGRAQRELGRATRCRWSLLTAAAVDVLAFSPHPDDVEFFCGGSMLLAAQAGLKTAIVDLTEGELSTNGDPVRRSAEREAASELLGLETRVSLGLPDGSLGADGATGTPSCEALRELAPRVVLAPYWEDRHPDHEAAGRIVREACFFSRGREGRRGAGSPHRRVYWYMLHHASNRRS